MVESRNGFERDWLSKIAYITVELKKLIQTSLYKSKEKLLLYPSTYMLSIDIVHSVFSNKQGKYIGIIQIRIHKYVAF